MLGGEHRNARASGDPELQFVAFADATGVLEELAHRGAERRLVDTGTLHVARQREQLESRRLLGAELLEPLGAVADDRRQVGDRLDVVDDRGSAVEAGDRGERRLETRLAAAALERVEQRRLLAADVGARTRVDHDVEVEARAEDVLAEEPGGVGLAYGARDPTDDVRNLAADVDEGVVRADGVGRVDAALDEGVRVVVHERDVLAGTRLRLVTVDDEVVGATGVLRDEAPLHAGREACASAPTQAGLLDQRDDVVRVDTKADRHHRVAAVTAVALDRV